MIKFAICDDEAVMRDQISACLSDYMKDRQMFSYDIAQFGNGKLLLESECNFDLIFLDIQMDGTNGMEIAKQLRRLGNHSLLVFITVLKEWVFDAFQVQAYDYLVKPLDSIHFRQTMDRALSDLTDKSEKYIVIQRENSCQVILLSQIVYCEVLGRKIYIHQTDGNVVDYYDRLEKLEKRVDSRFFKCHRSYLVNLEHVRGCSAGQVLLSQGEKVPVSRLREHDFLQALLWYMKERNC